MQTSRPLPAELDIAAKVGALLYETTAGPHAVLTAVVARLRAQGVTVGGLLQRMGERLPGGKHSFWLDDIATGQAIRLDEPRGPSARSCTLDTDALAQGAYLLRRATEAGLDVIIVSRFGSLEAEGNGLRSEIADAICSGIGRADPGSGCAAAGSGGLPGGEGDAVAAVAHRRRRVGRTRFRQASAGCDRLVYRFFFRLIRVSVSRDRRHTLDLPGLHREGYRVSLRRA